MPYDMLFVITMELNILLYRHNAKTGLELLSMGSVADTIGERREAPFSFAVGPKFKYIAVMIYDSLIKIIPTEFDPVKGTKTLKNCFSMKVKHSNVHSLSLFSQDDSYSGDGQFGVFYQH